jgi:hypothetical protein
MASFGNKSDEIQFPPFSFDNNSEVLVIVLTSVVAPTGVTFNGDALTKLGSTTSARSRFQTVWYVKNADIGNYTVGVTGGSNHYAKLMGFNGYDLVNTFEGTTSASGTSSTPSITVTPTSDNTYVFAAGTQGDSPTAGANTTSYTGGTQPFLNFWRSTNPVSPATAFTVNVNSTNEQYGFIGFAIKPVSAAVATTNFFF